MKDTASHKISPDQVSDMLQKLASLLSDLHPKRGKGYFLSKIPSKKFGYTYYVRYMDKGQLVPSKWSTGTSDQIEADIFAFRNRDRLLTAYYSRGSAVHQKSMYKIMQNYYKPGSAYLEKERSRGRTLSGHTSRAYQSFIKDTGVPFFRRHGVKEFADLTPPLIFKLQNSLLRKHKPQTVNYYIGSLKTMFDFLVLEGTITENVFLRVKTITVTKECRETTGCYNVDDVKGVFNKRWTDRRSYLLCLLIYTTNLRNGEIERIKLEDIAVINKIHFLKVEVSKTANGVRMVPLHPFVYSKLKQYAKDKKPDEYVFFPNGKNNESVIYRKACMLMGERLGKDAAYLERERISFYSGRKYWKTLMSAEGLGDVEEYFMGHKVSSDVSKLYNHKDKQGKNMLAKKAREVFRILDKRLFMKK
ncbi:MAG: hypothetical protein Pg6C_06120 [Treponemataceae bacterium]|nr:MAG: hypothetical protein Pg6C_06120 [Treponemataceae bacterium]